MSLRPKGLQRVREVRKILEGIGHKVEGPGYKTCFFAGRLAAVHSDYFGCFDLISYDPELKIFIGHQVSDLKNKGAKVKMLQKATLPGWVWAWVGGRNKTFYRVFMIDSEGEIMEGSIQWKL